MLFLAVRSEGLSTIQEISDAYGISKNHLMKVVQRLGELGWVDTVRGRNGGLRINANSGRLTIGEVVRATESDFALVGCFGGEGQGVEHRSCVIEPHCRLKGVLYAAREAFFSELDRHTIAELSRPRLAAGGRARHRADRRRAGLSARASSQRRRPPPSSLVSRLFLTQPGWRRHRAWTPPGQTESRACSLRFAGLGPHSAKPCRAGLNAARHTILPSERLKPRQAASCWSYSKIGGLFMRIDKLTTKLQEALADAQSQAVGHDNQYIEPVHLILALLTARIDGARALAAVSAPA